MSLLRDRMQRDMERAGLAQRTREEYIRAVQDLARFHGRSPDLLEPDDIRTWDEDLVRRRLSSSSRCVRHAGVTFFYRRTLFRPDMVACLIRPRKVPRKLPQVLTPAEVCRLLAAVRSPKYRALFALLYDTGLRITEALNLKVGDLDRSRGVIHVHGGKGGKDRLVKLGDRLYGILRAYWQEVRQSQAQEASLSRESYLFVNRSGGPLSAQIAQRIIKLSALECGLAGWVTPHTLRHSFATAQMEAGTSLPVLQAQLGHRDISTTQIYLHVATHLLLERPNPLDRLVL
jgi:integrase/recombinase XerD